MKKERRRDREAVDACRVVPGSAPNLADIDTQGSGGPDSKKAVREYLENRRTDFEDWQNRFYASASCSLLVVFQAMDTAGKDGVIRSIFGPLNPQGVTVAPFKRPTPDEIAHDYLWRVHARTPAKGMIAVFNRSHYEDVLVPSVDGGLPPKGAARRCEQINAFEKHLSENGTHIVKFYLHISKGEQRRRLQERLDDPEKLWKFDPGDLPVRAKWDQYMAAYENILARTSTDHAPWFIIPADRKWRRDWLVSRILDDLRATIALPLPPQPPGLDSIRIED